MSTIMRDKLHIGDAVYTIDACPLEACLAALPDRPPARTSPFSLHGYVATWGIHDGTMYLREASAAALACLFPGLPVAASWFSGLIRGWRGDRRETGYPPRTCFDDEIVLEIASGKVVRIWTLDLRHVPPQTGDELSLSLPGFLLVARPREDQDG